MLVRPTAPSHQIHSIYGSFSLMHAGGGLSAHGASGHGLSLFVPPELRTASPSSRRSSTNNRSRAPTDHRSRGAEPPTVPTVGTSSTRAVPRRAPPPPPPASSSSRNTISSPSPRARKTPSPPRSPPPPPLPAHTEAIVEEDPFADHVTVYTTPRHPAPAPSTRAAESSHDSPSTSLLRDNHVLAVAPERSPMASPSHPVLSYATIHAHAMEASRRAAQAERERRARIVASILLTRAARAGAHPLRRRPSTEEPAAKSYVSSSLKTMVTVA